MAAFGRAAGFLSQKKSNSEVLTSCDKMAASGISYNKAPKTLCTGCYSILSRTTNEATARDSLEKSQTLFHLYGAKCLRAAFAHSHPGYSLSRRDPSSLKVTELKFWLRCRGDKAKV